MDEFLIENPDEETTEQEQEFNLATVGAVGANGVTLIFDGQDAATSKVYKVNNSVRFVAGDRVRIKKDSGTYLVEFVVGAPMARYPLPSGGSSGQVLAKSSNNDYAVEWTTVSAAQIKNGSYTMAMSSAGVLEPSSTSVHLGSSTKPFGNLYAQSVVYLGNSYSGEVHIGAASGSKLGFFGHTASARQTVASTATVATLITALKAYGLIA